MPGNLSRTTDLCSRKTHVYVTGYAALRHHTLSHYMYRYIVSTDLSLPVAGSCWLLFVGSCIFSYIHTTKVVCYSQSQLSFLKFRLDGEGNMKVADFGLSENVCTPQDTLQTGQE